MIPLETVSYKEAVEDDGLFHVRGTYHAGRKVLNAHCYGGQIRKRSIRRRYVRAVEALAKEHGAEMVR